MSGTPTPPPAPGGGGGSGAGAKILSPDEGHAEFFVLLGGLGFIALTCFGLCTFCLIKRPWTKYRIATEYDTKVTPAEERKALGDAAKAGYLGLVAAACIVVSCFLPGSWSGFFSDIAMKGGGEGITLSFSLAYAQTCVTQPWNWQNHSQDVFTSTPACDAFPEDPLKGKDVVNPGDPPSWPSLDKGAEASQCYMGGLNEVLMGLCHCQRVCSPKYFEDTKSTVPGWTNDFCNDDMVFLNVVYPLVSTLVIGMVVTMLILFGAMMSLAAAGKFGSMWQLQLYMGCCRMSQGAFSFYCVAGTFHGLGIMNYLGQRGGSFKTCDLPEAASNQIVDNREETVTLPFGYGFLLYALALPILSFGCHFCKLARNTQEDAIRPAYKLASQDEEAPMIGPAPPSPAAPPPANTPRIDPITGSEQVQQNVPQQGQGARRASTEAGAKPPPPPRRPSKELPGMQAGSEATAPLLGGEARQRPKPKPPPKMFST